MCRRSFPVKSTYSISEVKCVAYTYIYFFSRTLVLIFTSFHVVLPVFLVPVSFVVMVYKYVLWSDMSECHDY